MRWRVTGSSGGMQQHQQPDDDELEQQQQQTPATTSTSRLEEGDSDEPDLATCSEDDEKTMTPTGDGEDGAARDDNPQKRLHPREHEPPARRGRLGAPSSALSDQQDDMPLRADLAPTRTTPTSSAAIALSEADDEGGGIEDAEHATSSNAAMALDTGEEEKLHSESDHHYQQQQHGTNNGSSPSHASSSSSANPSHGTTSSSQIQQDGDKDEEGDEEGVDHSQPPPDQDDGDDASTTRWKPQTSQSTCEFTHTITNYSQKRESGCKKAEYSSTTVDEFGNRWRLIVYVNGNGRASNHHLSLFLQVADADDLPFGWKKAVSYVLTLEHPTGANLSYAKRNPDKTFKLCPKAIDWGWSQFITSDRIQQEGFVSNDCLTVRASVTVKSSSVSIDLEDAELYLKCAVEEGNASAVKLCLAQGAGVNCKFKDDLYTPLHTACSSSSTGGGSMEVLELLLERGADGNACNKWRETPLLIAANNGHRAAVEALLQHGADPSLCSEAGWSALTFAAHKGYDDIVALLLRAGAPVNCRVTEDSSTPLHKACAGSKPGHLVAVTLLLDGGADVHALNKWRETPLLTAANHGQAGAVEALLKAGADPCKCTDTGWSPLSIAAYKGHDDVVRLLLEEGAPTEEADPTLSALLQAATKGLPGTVELLLRHGADHTVTTKKGDTALSILVEQNLIDAAVEMVTEYKASVPRCSRDRKKVQRARLLINLRVKQQQREGILGTTDDEDADETDQEDSSEELTSAQHDGNGKGGNTLDVGNASTPDSRKKKGKKNGGKSNKMSAEQQAKAAEEALLLELEQEDAKARKEEQEANKKSAKKRKKKERERQQKLKEEQKRREKEELEMQEKEQRQKEKEEKLRKEREEKAKIQREKELKEAAEREKIAAAKRREREEKERRQQEKQLQQQQRQDKKVAAAAATTPTSTSNYGLTPLEKRARQPKPKGAKKQQQHATAPTGTQPNRTTGNESTSPRLAVNSSMPAPASVASAPVLATTSQNVGPTKKRGWENKPQSSLPLAESRQTPPNGSPSEQAPLNSSLQGNSLSTQVHTPPSNYLTPKRSNDPANRNPNKAQNGMADFLGFDTHRSVAPAPPSPYAPAPIGELGGMLTPQQPKPVRDVEAFTPTATTQPMRNGLTPSHYPVTSTELPSVAIYRREKVAELLQRCAMARSQSPSSTSLSVVGEDTIKKVLYRWIVRAAHDQDASLDCIIPSWINFDQLTTFFQRQFIAESRKGVKQSARGTAMVNMESLKEAGSAMAILCQSLSKEIAEYRRRMEEQVPQDWSDQNAGITASDVIRNGGVAMVLIDWANRAQVYLPATTFAKLRDRYAGPSKRLLTSMFLAKIRYDTQRLIVADTTMDFRIPASTKASLAVEAGVTAELWSDPLSALSNSIFFGQFYDVDSPFGGLKPFGNSGGEELLARHGGSFSLLAPLDNMVASRYLHGIIDLLEGADGERVPLSFVVFLRTECFHDRTEAPTVDDLHLLDSRLGDRGSVYMRRAISLAGGQHSYQAGDGMDVFEVSRTGSLLILLQNNAGRTRFGVRDAALAEIIRSMNPSRQPQEDHHVVTPMSSFTNDFVGTNDTQQQHSHAAPGYFDPIPAISPMPQPITAADFGTIGGTAISKAFSTQAQPNPASNAGVRRRGRLFDLVDDGEEDNLNEVDVVSGMLNNLDLYNISQDVDIEAISLMGIGGPPTGIPPAGSSRGRFG